MKECEGEGRGDCGGVIEELRSVRQRRRSVKGWGACDGVMG